MKAIRLNWAWLIASAYLGFVVLIMTLVFKSTSQKIDLVTSQYYAEELHFQDKIQQKQRANALAEPVTWEVANGSLSIRFPKLGAPGNISGTARLYCPSDDRNDRTFTLQPAVGEQAINLTKVPHARYKLEISWQQAGVTYWNEGVVNLLEQ